MRSRSLADAMAERKRCSGCWEGDQFRSTPDEPWTDCDACGLPGPQPADYEWNGEWVTHYMNHGNTWQSASDGRDRDGNYPPKVVAD